MMIDATDKQGLTQDRLQQFIDEVNDKDIDVSKNDEKLLACKKEELIEKVFKCISVQDNDIITFQTDSTALRFDGQNFLWWTKTSKRLERLEAIFNKNAEAKPAERKASKKKQATVLEEKTYYIGIATLVDNELTNIHHFEGSKNDCIEFINNDIVERYVDATLNAKIVINFAFDAEEFERVFSDASSKEEKDAYKRDINMWYTLDELELMGAITTK